jgi:hypothetical protein
MLRFGKVIALAAVVALMLVGCNEGNDEGGTFDLSLSGANEVCDDEGSCGGEGTGTGTVEIDSDKNDVCYEFTFEGVEGVTAAHIHSGPEGEAGEVLVDLQLEGDDEGAEGCVTDIDESVLEDISEEPERHYVNVHTEEFPDGALRAQLQD